MEGGDLWRLHTWTAMSINTRPRLSHVCAPKPCTAVSIVRYCAASSSSPVRAGRKHVISDDGASVCSGGEGWSLRGGRGG